MRDTAKVTVHVVLRLIQAERSQVLILIVNTILYSLDLFILEKIYSF